MKKILKYIIVFTILIITFLSLLTISALIPSSNIKTNVKSSAELLLKEGNRKNVLLPFKFLIMQFDNYTDALMINTAYSIDDTMPLYSSLVARKNYLPSITQTVYEETVGELSSVSKYKWHNEVGELYDTVSDDITESFEYSRYWHGYLVFLRPILLLFDLAQIRLLLLIIFGVLGFIVLYYIWRRIGFLYMIAFFLGLIGIEYFYMGFSMQGCFVFLITMIFIILLFKRFEKINEISLYFFIVGMCTNFFDFLTNPIITLFVPLIIYFLLLQKEKKLTMKDTIIVFLKIGTAWLLGYGLTWITKWILVDVICGKNTLETAWGQVLYRSVGERAEKSSLKKSLLNNFVYIWMPSILEVCFILIVIFISVLEKHKKNVSVNHIINSIFPYMIISIIPYIWYVLLKNHSSKHAFFTYREQIMTLISFPIAFIKFRDIFKLKNKENK